MADDQKEIRYCAHIESGESRPYRRLSGATYDLIICWKCQSEGGQMLAKLDDIKAQFARLFAPKPRAPQ